MNFRFGDEDIITSGCILKNGRTFVDKDFINNNGIAYSIQNKDIISFIYKDKNIIFDGNGVAENDNKFKTGDSKVIKYEDKIYYPLRLICNELGIKVE